MFRQISIGLAALLSGTILAGCFDSQNRSQDALDEARVSNADVIVSGPEGYCIDRTSLRRRGEENFALIASCHSLSGGTKGMPQAPVLVSVSIGPSGEGTPLPSAVQIAKLAKAPLLTQQKVDGLVLARLGTSARDFLNGKDAHNWRGVFTLNGHLISMSLYAPKGSAYAATAGGDFLERTRTRITQLSAADPESQTQTASSKAGFLAKLFGDI